MCNWCATGILGFLVAHAYIHTYHTYTCIHTYIQTYIHAYIRQARNGYTVIYELEEDVEDEYIYFQVCVRACILCACMYVTHVSMYNMDVYRDV